MALDNRKRSARTQASCQTWVSNPIECRRAARSTACSDSNQASACFWSAGLSGVTPGLASVSVNGRSRCRLSSFVGAAGGVQVVIKHPVPGRIAVVVGVVGVGDFGGVRAEQVVKGEPARNTLGDQVCSGQLG